MAACGLLGYVLVRYKYGVAPMALGLILGTTMEEGFKLSLHLGSAEGNIMLFFFSRPQSLVLIILTLLSLGYSIWKECGAKKVRFWEHVAFTAQWRIRLSKKMLGCGAAHQEGCR